MASILIRTIIIYILLTTALKIMGKRQIGELDVGELITTLLISELATIPIDDPDLPLLNAVLPILLIFSLEIIISSLKNRSERLKRLLESSPVYIIYKGKLSERALVENRLSLNELLCELRLLNVGDIGEVEYAILEQNGKISVFKKSDGAISHSLIIDTVILKDNLKRLGLSDEWVKKQLKERGAKIGEILLLTLSDDGSISLIKKEKNE
ncbi:MAG: DUF421 domain-containing protein [Clostridia bacterium]|nr:DUF421 domain-containing protein [Clostridia bacterium]